MHVANLKGERRKLGGKENNRIRNRGLIPGVIYGHKEDPEFVSVGVKELRLALDELQHVVSLDIGAGVAQYLIKDVQYDHLNKDPIHIDLMRVDANERVRVRVAVELKGDPHGAHEGGVLTHVMTEIEVECGVMAIPELIEPNVSHLGLNESLHVRDLKLPEGVVALSDPDDVIATVKAHRGVVEAPVVEGEEAAAEPEMIGRVAKTDEPE
ncbi:MAG: 50S ribosomal protein L25 [Phycisphaerales bacterium]|nr:50S ribosomal protein L25 [Phycisphaerales bacterium]